MTTPNAIDADWGSHAARLADELAKAGKLTDALLADAVRNTPRHVFVPKYYTQGPSGSWTERDSADDLAAVYTNTALITVLTADQPSPTVLSSSSQPGLMTRMIEALRLTKEMRVLEIGTGTGYNAALLSRLLGDRQVFSIDVEMQLVERAHARLAGLGLSPTLATGDGALGLPTHAPFDAIIATCAVRAIPAAWIEQLTPGGTILADLKVAPGAGSLVRMVRIDGDMVRGRFDPTYAAFMDLRHKSGENKPTFSVGRDHAHAAHSDTALDPNLPWTNLVVWFLASFDLGPRIAYGYVGSAEDDGPRACWLATPDGSWVEVELASRNGRHAVAEGGPRRLWQLIERADRMWTNLGQPGWGAFGLTVKDGAHTVWFEEPAGEHIWRLRS
jgi:protein-L-isoaspartate(D-aspartate) O-methyltransferase